MAAATLQCVFVVRFDVTQGNVLAATYPEGMLALDGLEFKAIPSGLHALRTDRVFLRQGMYPGVACFSNMPTDDTTQRNARMCSVGCLATDDPAVCEAMCEALQAEAQRQNEDAEAGRPADYSRLPALFATGRGSGAPLPAITTPPGSPSSFSSMVQFFGPSVFVLWKAGLLKKRILFFSPVPIEQGCMRVRWMEPMLALEQSAPAGGGSGGAPATLGVPSSLMYYVNVFDIDMLSTMESYIACTSERIFAEKPELYDIYVDGQNISYSTPELRKQLRTTPVDFSRFGLLTEAAYARDASAEGALRSYFAKRNSELVEKVEALCSIARGDASAASGSGGGGQLRASYRIRATQLEERLGLHTKDAGFVREFAAQREYQLEVDESIFDSLCSCC
jgi:hypothetical protein